MCNACGLFFKLHGVVRPPSLKMDLIKKRNRGVEEVPVFLRQRPGDPVSEGRYSPRRFVETSFWRLTLIYICICKQSTQGSLRGIVLTGIAMAGWSQAGWS